MMSLDNLPLFDIAQPVNTTQCQSGHRKSRSEQQGAKGDVKQSSTVRFGNALSVSSEEQIRRLPTYHLALPQNGRFPSVITEQDAVLRRESLDRYEYLLFASTCLGACVVRCNDTQDKRYWLEFGPFTEVEGNAFIDERVERAESLKR